MTQDLARIRAFVQVFDAGGFSAAARVHGRSKALLSKYVTDLEDTEVAQALATSSGSSC